MQRHGNKKILAVMSDLFFSVKINDAAKRAGLSVEFVKDHEEVLAKAKAHPTLIIFDLNFESVDPLGVIAKLKNTADLKNISVIGSFARTGRTEAESPRDCCDMVLARSAFSQNLAQILKRHSGTP